MRWIKKEISREEVRYLAERFGLDVLAASVFARRGIVEPSELRWYLETDPRFLHNPFLFEGMEDAVDRIHAAADEEEKVLVFGDRDVDGICSTAIMVGALRAMGIEPTWRLPGGGEPYGLSIAAVEEAARNYVSLIVTVDCGSSNALEIERARELGIDVIVVDHHNPGEAEPEAIAHINPKAPGSGYPFKGLAGCGVAYKVAEALRFSRTGLYKQQLCLLNARPVNEAYALEVLKLRNMRVVDTLRETLVPGMVELERTRLVPFLQGQQILVYGAELQKRMLERALGTGVEINMYDVAPEIWKAMPALSGTSLIGVREKSRMARYYEGGFGELEAFESLFVSYVQRKEKVFAADDLDALQLVAMGTVADIMPLKDENRILVRKGLAAMAEAPRPGLAELLPKLVQGRRVGTHELSWQVCPVINAAGRLGKPAEALKLFLEEDAARRSALADSLIGLNKERRALGNEAWQALRPLAEESFERHERKLVLLGSEDIHRGVTGIMASRFMNGFKVPAIVATFQADGVAVGSLRSTRGFDVKAFLESNADLFIDYGGHDNAAGFSLPVERFDEFKARVIRYLPVIELEAEADEETLSLDAELPREYMKPELMGLVDTFEPTGESSPALVFACRGAKVAAADVIGKAEKNHLRLTLDFGAHKWPAVYWQAADRFKRDFDVGSRVDVAFNLGRNSYNGNEGPQLVILDLKAEGEE
jgi:single-stranded-DNA-specific exonuclease